MASIKRIMDNLNHVSTVFSVLISPAGLTTLMTNAKL